MPLHIKTFVVSALSQNARLLWDSQTLEGVLVDPGDDCDVLMNAVTQENVTLKAVVLTHSHIDHAAGVNWLYTLLPDPSIPLMGHQDDAPLRERIGVQAQMFGYDPSKYSACPEPTVYLNHLDRFKVGSYSFEARFTPGHAPGHLVFFAQPDSVVIDGKEYTTPILLSGDALFRGSIGRTDLPGGNFDVLMNSLYTQVLTLPEHTLVLSGHGSNTSIGHEKQHNPFFQ